ncbi:FAD-dependent oxidoreductase [Actinomadura sp. NBRC 104425]|uniref:FAD-dependent monooxygenase n=1 Tax=Actinomadura sp. NBRC 104425 TaxID=3032204 RepID=UPI0024A19698|nr:FAD-dependent monooxygenase [Actinomadura sp. NBRC 104425]GLZ11520.1 FAD-dependent oxidoreductase [Actinomadura sp. NBRC 104425]
MARRAVVVGGGIGGLAAAVALSRRGWQVRVCERAAEFTEIGAGISLWPNALRALAALDLAGRVRGIGAVESVGGVRDRSGRWLSRVDNTELERRYGFPVLMVHRADLVDVLADALPREALLPSTAVTGIGADGDTVVVEHGAGELRADLVVGADGLRSSVRRLHWPDARAPRYAGFTAWRMIAPPLPEPVAGGGETWGRGELFGFTAMTGGRTYCFAAATVPPGGAAPDGEAAELRRRFAQWPDPIPRLLDAVPADGVLRHDVYALPPLPGYAKGRVALLGDAAHAMAPNLGQGACQALEDAVVLAACLDQAADIESALVRYDRLRRPRTRRIARRSARMAALTLAKWPPAAAARDLGARLAPGAAAVRAMAPVLAWRP